MKMSEVRIAHDKYKLEQSGRAVVLVQIEPPSSGIVIRGTAADGNIGEIQVKGSGLSAVVLPFSALQITVERFPDLQSYSIQQVQRTIDLKPIR